MPDIAIKAENLSKRYELGSIGTGSLARDLQRWWSMAKGNDDPYATINANQLVDKSKEHWALKDVSFEIKQGEAVGIIGKNGAGKSTLLKILSRVTSPTSGTIKVKGRIASLLEVGTGFHGDLTGRENIFMNGAILGMSKTEIRSKLDEIIDFSGVENYIDTPVKRYSSGMYVRLAFAVAAHLEPDILVVDEVLAVGDAEFQKKCLGKMDEASKKEGRTVIFVSHNMGAIMSLCSVSLLIEAGKIIAKGKTEDIANLYSSKRQTSVEKPVSKRYRRGNGFVRFESIEFRNNNDEMINVVGSGMDFKICIKLLCNQEIEVSKLQIDIGISNDIGNEISWLSTSLSKQAFAIKNSGESLNMEFAISKLPLVPGNYYLTLFSKYNGIIADWIEDGHNLEVIFGDFYNNGKINIPYGNTMIYHSCNISI